MVRTHRRGEGEIDWWCGAFGGVCEYLNKSRMPGRVVSKTRAQGADSQIIRRKGICHPVIIGVVERGERSYSGEEAGVCLRWERPRFGVVRLLNTHTGRARVQAGSGDLFGGFSLCFSLKILSKVKI